MIIRIEKLLSRQQVDEFRALLVNAQWADGSITAGTQSTKAKNNLQLPADAPEALRIADAIYSALGTNALFIAAALPAKVFPPLFNCYQGGRYFDWHVDNAIRQMPGSAVKVRTDLSMTVFFSDPDEYEGGELLIQDAYGSHSVKLPAGDMILYPATSLHRVTPVTNGRRLASFFWAQSMVRSDAQRALLFELDQSIRQLRDRLNDTPETLRLTNVYHNLLRQYAEPG